MGTAVWKPASLRVAEKWSGALVSPTAVGKIGDVAGDLSSLAERPAPTSLSLANWASPVHSPGEGASQRSQSRDIVSRPVFPEGTGPRNPRIWTVFGHFRIPGPPVDRWGNAAKIRDSTGRIAIRRRAGR